MIAVIEELRNRHTAALSEAITVLADLANMTALPTSGELERQYLAAMQIVERAANVEITRLANGGQPTGGKIRRGDRVLGVWPSEALDYHRERNAYRAGGFDYRGLIGDAATKTGFLRERNRRDRIRILSIGAHGDDDGIHLHDGPADARWWSDVLASMVDLELVVLMACESDAIGDALVGMIPHVISVQRQIEDTAAATFVEMLALELGRHGDVETAYNTARLAVNTETYDMVSLR